MSALAQNNRPWRGGSDVGASRSPIRSVDVFSICPVFWSAVRLLRRRPVLRITSSTISDKGNIDHLQCSKSNSRLGSTGFVTITSVDPRGQR